MKKLVVVVLGAIGIVTRSSSSLPADAFNTSSRKGKRWRENRDSFYGGPRFEAALIGANSLDAHGGSAIVPGQPLEVPAPTHYRVADGETWFTLAKTYLGDRETRRCPRAGQSHHGVDSAGRAPRDRDSSCRRAHRRRRRHADDAVAAYYNDANKSWTIAIYNGGDDKRKFLRGDVCSFRSSTWR